MSNFSPKLETATDEQLRLMINEYDYRVVPLASDELTRRTINSLTDEVKDLNSSLKSAISSNNRVSLILLFFTVVQILIAILTFVSSLLPNKWYITILAIIFAVAIFWLGRFFDPLIMKGK